MRKLMSVLLSVGLVFSAFGGFTVEAKSFNSPRVSTPAPKVSTPSTSKPSTSKPSTSTSKSTTTSKPSTTSGSVKPAQKGVNYSKYNGKPYYNLSSGFSTNLMTAMGVYLILDGFDDMGEPIYVNAETGEEYDVEDLEELDVSPVEEEVEYDNEYEDDYEDDYEDSELPVWLGFILIAFVIVLVCLLAWMIFSY